MLAERLLTAVVRDANKKYLRLTPTEVRTLPDPVAGREYMLYVHVPFCTRLCPYCSFNRFPFSVDRAVPYFGHLRREMQMVADLGYDFTSMYVGGGTPTVMIDELCDTIDRAKSLFSIREVSSESNPDHLVPEIVDPLIGRVNRFSVGVQSFDNELLKQMERYDKYGSAEDILERLKWAAGRFHSLNVDMIFNFPSQTREMLLRDVEMLKASGTNQTTFYPLMASPAVRKSLRQTVGAVSYRRENAFYQAVSDALSGSFEHASAWTFSRTGGGMIDEYIVDYEDYVGIGSGAFSFLNGALWVNTFSLAEYAERIDAGKTGATAKRDFSSNERMRYRFMMGLFGLSLDKKAFERDFGVSIERGLPVEITFMRAAGAFDRNDDERITLTPRGRYLLVAMMREFFVGVNSVRDQARSALPDVERELLFGDAGEAACVSADAVAVAAGQTEDDEHLPVPPGAM
ncbi:MAG: coproporphyrinogen III oxidase family protein [Actinomycetota bacterium]|nr:coproporphyrinogen III oxidase family protein [Actinomycetota bacterium]